MRPSPRPVALAAALALAASALAQAPSPEPPVAAPPPAEPSPSASASPPPPPLPAAAPRKSTAKKARAADVIIAMERAAQAAGRLVKSERSKEPALRSRKSRALKKNLAATAKLLGQLREETARKDAAMLRTARALDKSMGALDTAFRFSGVRVPEIAEALGKLQSTWEIYDGDFGRRLLAKGKEDFAEKPLGGKAEAKLGEFRRQMADLAKRLRALEAALKKYRGISIELTWLATEADTLTRTPSTQGAFLTALHRAQWVEGKFQGLNDYVDLVYPSAAKDFDALDTFWMSSGKETAAAHAELFAGLEPTTIATAEVPWRAVEQTVALPEADAAAGAAYLESGWESETDEAIAEAEAMRQDASFEEDENSDDVDTAGDLDEEDADDDSEGD